MKALLLLIVALAFGCDDPDVSAKALDILEHGIVSARVDCSACAVSNGSTGDTIALYTAHRMLDGSCLSREGDKTRFCARDESCAADCRSENVSVSGGQIRQDIVSGADRVADIETCCTGFNLEAFGVE